ncbi:MAG: alpha/beta hydrolase, partial [Candidatus Enteromonas sp.]
ETISDFAEQAGASLTIMKGGEHWFHTDSQMRFLDDWIRKNM